MVERAVRDPGRVHGGVCLATVGGCPGFHIINLSGYTLIYIGMALAEEHCAALFAVTYVLAFLLWLPRLLMG